MGGSIVTAAGLVFISATNDHHFRAFDARTGKILWDTELKQARTIRRSPTKAKTASSIW